MPITAAQFRTALPEFKNIGDGAVQAALAEAYLRTGDSWGELRDVGAKWMAADLIASSVLAEPSAKGKNAQGQTVYRRNWEQLLRQVRVWGSPVGGVPLYPEVAD